MELLLLELISRTWKSLIRVGTCVLCMICYCAAVRLLRDVDLLRFSHLHSPATKPASASSKCNQAGCHTGWPCPRAKSDKFLSPAVAPLMTLICVLKALLKLDRNFKRWPVTAAWAAGTPLGTRNGLVAHNLSGSTLMEKNFSKQQFVCKTSAASPCAPTMNGCKVGVLQSTRPNSSFLWWLCGSTSGPQVNEDQNTSKHIKSVLGCTGNSIALKEYEEYWSLWSIFLEVGTLGCQIMARSVLCRSTPMQTSGTLGCICQKCYEVSSFRYCQGSLGHVTKLLATVVRIALPSFLHVFPC